MSEGSAAHTQPGTYALSLAPCTYNGCHQYEPGPFKAPQIRTPELAPNPSHCVVQCLYLVHHTKALIELLIWPIIALLHQTRNNVRTRARAAISICQYMSGGGAGACTRQNLYYFVRTLCVHGDGIGISMTHRNDEPQLAYLAF